MPKGTRIEWTEAVWNPITGCTKVSPGCKNCYAERMAKRLRGRHGYPKKNPFTVTTHPNRLDEPYKWKKPKRIFVCSMGDLFHPQVYPSFLTHVWGVMRFLPRHTFIILTKRPERMRDFCSHSCVPVLPNVWLGVSVEDQEHAEERIPILIQTPARVRLISIEPMLNRIDLTKWIAKDRKGVSFTTHELVTFKCAIHWVICGGESGPGARPMDPAWATYLMTQCANAEVPFFMKQMGGVYDKRSQLSKIPKYLRIREYPNAQAVTVE